MNMNAAPAEPITDILFAELPLPDGSLVRLRVPDESDHISKVYLSGQWYEKDLLDYCYRHFTPGKVFIDVGAFIGGHALWFATACRAASVFAFEPNPDAYYYLLKNVSQLPNWFLRVAVSSFALGPNRQHVTIEGGPPGNMGMARTVQAPGGCLPMIRLDDMLAGLPVDVIKIDVEGMAPGVLAGAMETLERYRPALFVECRTEDERIEVTQILEPFGYHQRGVFGWTPTYLFEVA